MITIIHPERQNIFDMKITEANFYQVLEHMANNGVTIKLTHAYNISKWNCDFILYYESDDGTSHIKGTASVEETPLKAVGVAMKMFGKKYREIFNDKVEEFPALELLK